MDIVGNQKIVLRQGTGRYPFSVVFSAATSATANDGSIPYGTVISSVDCTVVDSAGADIKAATVDSIVVASGGLRVDLKLNFPPLAAVGKCVLMLILTLSSASTIVKRWDGLWIE